MRTSLQSKAAAVWIVLADMIKAISMGPNIKLQGGDVCQLLMNQKSVPQMPIVMCGSVPSIRVPCNREYHTQRDRQDNVVSDKKRWRAEQEKVYLTLQDQNTLCDNKVDYDIWDLALLGILEYQDNLKLRNEVTSGPLLSQQNSEVISSSLTGCFACPIRWPLEVNVVYELTKLTFDIISVPPQGATQACSFKMTLSLSSQITLESLRSDVNGHIVKGRRGSIIMKRSGR